MDMRKSAFDVTGTVDVTKPEEVKRAVHRIFTDVYDRDALPQLDRAFADISALVGGGHPDFHACDTPYHDLQHVLDVTLAMARIVAGHDTDKASDHRLGPDMALLGVLVALFHDVGYLRRRRDHVHGNGSEYTTRHVSRGARLLASYLPALGISRRQTRIAQSLIHFTGYERKLDRIPIRDATVRKLGAMLGSADLLAQMSDRCYLEKCHDRLYFELEMAKRNPGPVEPVWVFDSPADLIRKTPAFFRHAVEERLNGSFRAVHEYAHSYLGDRHLYLEWIEKNRRYLLHALQEKTLPPLRRRPPWTLAVRPEGLGLM